MTAPDPKPAPMSDQEALAVLRDVVRYERKVGNDEWADEIDQARAHIAARLGSGEVVATVGECAELQWHKGGVCQLPPGTKLYTHPQPAAVSEAEVEAAARTMFDRHCSGKTYVSAEHTEHSWNCLRDVYIADARAALTAARAAKGEG